MAGRARVSQWPMVTVAEAQAMVLAQCAAMMTEVEGVSVLATEMVGYREAQGRVLCQDVAARDPLPPFPASIKDGYAVIAADGAGVRRVLVPDGGNTEAVDGAEDPADEAGARAWRQRGRRQPPTTMQSFG